MFSTLETTWDRSPRRGWTTFASFTFQALALSLLLLVPLFSMQGPPRLEWLRTLVAPPAESPTPPVMAQQNPSSLFSNMIGTHLQTPRAIPKYVAENVNDGGVPPQMPYSGPGVGDPTGSPIGVPFSTGPAMPILITKPTIPTRPFKTSTWAEGNLVHKVQPAYPPIAIAARIQGTVQLRAIISKTGTIENLIVENGHPMLVAAAINAVKQWRYRPYLLNHEPIEVETEITVNFTLGGS